MAEERPEGDAGRIFLLVLGALALFAQPGAYINDEVAQAAALHSLAEGELLVWAELPVGYLPFVGDYYRHWGIPDYGDPPAPPVASPLLNLLALPVLLALRSIAFVLDARWAMAAVVAVATSLGARAAWRLVKGRDARPPPWLLLGTLAFVPLLDQRPLAPAPYLELFALQAVSMAATATAAMAIYSLLLPRYGRRTAICAALLLGLASPAFFWGLSAKYHALSMALFAGILWAYRPGSFVHTWLAFAIAGLAVFNYPPMGLLALAALGLTFLGNVRTGARQFSLLCVAAATGFLVGVFPELVYRFALLEATGGVGFVPGSSHIAAGQGQGTGAFGSLARQGIFHDPLGAFDAAWRATFWTDLFHGKSKLPLIAVGPWVAAIAYLARREHRLDATAAIAAFHIVLLLLLTSKSLLATVGLDPRYAASGWPGLAVLAGPLLARATSGSWVESSKQAAMLGVGLICFAATWNMVLHAIGMTPTPEGWNYDQLLVHRWAGFLSFAALLGVAVVGPWAAHRPAALASTLMVGISTQVWLQMLFANRVGLAPFVVWPMELLSRALYWMAFQT